MKITVIGCGRWGSFIAWYLDHIGHEVSLYGREGSANMQRFMAERRNDYIELPESLKLTTDINSVLDSEVVVISIGSQNLEKLIEQLAQLGVRDKIFVLCMKGIEMGTGRRLSEIATAGLDKSNRVAVWIGPGHVQEFYKVVPNCMDIDSLD